MNKHFHPLLPAHRLGVLVLAAGCALPALSQPTGNPKGSAAPPVSDSQKAPAARPPTQGMGESGKIVTDPDKVNSRAQTMKPAANPGPPQPTPDKAPGRSSSGATAKGAGPVPKPVPQ